MKDCELRFYHIFNRGVEKRDIFLDDTDKVRFIHDLYEFNDTSPAPRFSENLSGEDTPSKRNKLVSIACFSLMPNHHHLLLGETEERKRTLFVKKLHGGYARAFNEKHKRSGYLFQGRYKKVLIKNEQQLLQIVCYIHANPLDLWRASWKETKLTPDELIEALYFLEKYRWSSHLDYLGKKNFPSVIDKAFLEKVFGEYGGYEKFFVNWVRFYQKESETLKDFSLE